MPTINTLLRWRGADVALSAKQRAALKPEWGVVRAQAEYFLELGAPLTRTEQKHIEALLVAQPVMTETAGFWLTPRQGTVSAWAAKAQEILQSAGIAKVARLERCQFFPGNWALAEKQSLAMALYDPLLESVFFSTADFSAFFRIASPGQDPELPLLEQGLLVLIAANSSYGLALSKQELEYLFVEYQKLDRNPTLAEIMMFAQANSEHCRHKIFRAQWQTATATLPSLFSHIQATTQKTPQGVVLAYDDNAAVIAPCWTLALQVLENGEYLYKNQEQGMVIKVETHNHPTLVEPFAGAATGVGGEIRDEGATGRGGCPKAGLAGFAVADLCLPTLPETWEIPVPPPPGRASALAIMREAPVGAAAFNNEFGRPNLLGFFRVFSGLIAKSSDKQQLLGYHKPLMLAGGWGSIFLKNLPKQQLSPGDLLIVLGGPALRIGLGGGAASSLPSGSNHQALDFASVQRSNPELQRRCQEVLRRCYAAEVNPILSIHDVGAGGLANALPELVEAGGVGAHIDFAKIPNAEPSLTAMELWCNEAQERYVLAIAPKDLERFQAFCKAERCPFAVLGEACALPTFTAIWGEQVPVQLPLRLLFAAPPVPLRPLLPSLNLEKTVNYKNWPELSALLAAVLRQPSVACKRFLISIGDRSVGGFTARDQNVGPWQTPVADVAVTFRDDISEHGEAAALGERPLVAPAAPAVSARLAVAEALTNLWAAAVADWQTIKLSANWMADCPAQDADLYQAVSAISEFCQDLELAIPVGKDSLSMRVRWTADPLEYQSQAPLTVVISAFAPVTKVAATFTPQLQPAGEIWLLRLGQWGLGGSIAAQVSGQWTDEQLLEETQNFPDIDSESLKRAWAFWQAVRLKVSAYHDLSDGGLWAGLCEMAFASRCGLAISAPFLDASALRDWLLAEGVGFLFQVPLVFREELLTLAKKNQLDKNLTLVGEPTADGQITVRHHRQVLLQKTRAAWQGEWEKVSVAMQSLRDDPDCALEEASAVALDTPFLFANIKSLSKEACVAPALKLQKPTVAILREQGSNGQREMAAAFLKAGFCAVDVSMADLLSGQKNLREIQALAVCGGFSFGDVLGAGLGWAKSILFTPKLADIFSEFFARPNTLTLGVCNGCQMLSGVKSLIPGAEHFPRWQHNRSQQFEARWTMVEVKASTSLWFTPLVGAQLPIVVAHGEGRVSAAVASAYIGMQFIDFEGKVTESYPFNPNGSFQGITALSSEDGRVSILMPHPERAVRRGQFSYWPAALSAFPWGEEESPWLQLFYQANRLL